MHTVDTWTLDGGLTARLVVDEHAESPRDWHNVATLVQLSERHAHPDEPDALGDALLRAWRYFGDLDRLERYARAYLGAVVIDTRDDPASGSRVLGIITDIDAAREHLADPSATLRAELDTYRDWAEGRVYGVIVTASDGREASLWGCYDDNPGFLYLYDVANDLATEVNAQPVTAARDGVTVSLFRAGDDQHLSVLIETADADLPDDPSVGPLRLLVTLNDDHLYDTTNEAAPRS
ncbi:hypothetical protein [Haloechinothrix salitolerans]|uniref:Uncharacterized protein n=1 Tax=Haloechinothrix salitolerans TaxID=926830 RepID=A0ABW2C6K4_9PSEU